MILLTIVSWVITIIMVGYSLKQQREIQKLENKLEKAREMFEKGLAKNKEEAHDDAIKMALIFG